MNFTQLDKALTRAQHAGDYIYATVASLRFGSRASEFSCHNWRDRDATYSTDALRMATIDNPIRILPPLGAIILDQYC